MNDYKVELLPIFDDNYIFALTSANHRELVVVDPGESAAVEDYLRTQGLQLKAILLTHHHADHIGGAQELQQKFQCPVYAPLKNKKQIPFADIYLQEGDQVALEPWTFEVMELPGHTLGHIVFWEEQRRWLFSGDVLFGLGCGRLFEGTFEQAFQSLKRICTLPDETLIYCTHEYTEANLRFCKILSPQDNTPLTGNDEILELYENQTVSKRSLGLPTVPLRLSLEKQVNPFLLAKDVEQFRYLRELRNRQ